MTAQQHLHGMETMSLEVLEETYWDSEGPSLYSSQEVGQEGDIGMYQAVGLEPGSTCPLHNRCHSCL